MRKFFTPPEFDGQAAAVSTFSTELDDDIGYEAALPYLLEHTARDTDGAAPWQAVRHLIA